MKRNLLSLLALFSISGTALADTVYVTARPSPCTVTANCPGANTDGTYSEQFPGLGDYGAVGSALGHPQTTVARTYIGSAVITDTNYGVTLTPTLGIPGAVYRIDYNFNSTAGNVSTNVILSAACTSGGKLSFTNTDKLQRPYGNPATRWNTLGYLTNDPGSATPTIVFRYESGRVSGAGAGAAGNRLLFDCWAFVLAEPCLAIAPLAVTGPLSSDVNSVVVTGVDATASKITVYQDSGSGMVAIGTKTTGIAAGNNTVTVAGLVKGAQVGATQTIGTQEGCVPKLGTKVGGGANPRLRLALSIKEAPTATGPVGADAGTNSNSNIHFVPATSVLSGSCPGEGALTIYPSNDWQTVSVSLGRATIGNSANANGVLSVPTGSFSYYGTYTVAINVHAYKTVGGTVIYSPVGAASATLTSNDVFTVKWTWDAVPGAEGYRVLRDWNGGGFVEFMDVTGTSFTDDSYTGWNFGNTVTPTSIQSTSSIQWYPTIGNANLVPGTWGVLEAIGLVSDDETDCGPYDLYIDNLANGANGVFQDFEGFVAGTAAGVVFNQPSYSGTTGGNLLTAPNTATVSNGAADTGTKSIRVRWQFTSGATNLWMRFNTYNTSVMPNPLVNLDQPISFRLLMQPVGATPVAPPRPELRISKAGNDVILNWDGAHNLQQAGTVAGPYANVPNVTKGPYTITAPTGAQFFRLAN